MIKPSRGEKIFNVFNMTFLGLLAFTTVYPFVYTVSISLSTAAEAQREGLHLYPREVSLTAYKMVFSSNVFLYGYANTLFRTIVGTFLTLLMTSLFAYPLSKRNLPHRGVFMFVILFTMVFGGGLVPMYLLIKNLGLIDNRLVYVLPGMIGAFNVIIIKNFFQSIPDSLAESAAIDGASDWRILFQIYMPLSKPVLATVALWTAVGHWNAWFDAMIYISTPEKLVMQAYLREIVIESSTAMVSKGLIDPDTTQFTPATIKAATVIVTLLPILLVYPFIQKHFMKGIMIGSIKG